MHFYLHLMKFFTVFVSVQYSKNNYTFKIFKRKSNQITFGKKNSIRKKILNFKFLIVLNELKQNFG